MRPPRRPRPPSDRPLGDLLLDPGDDLVQGNVQRRRALDAQDLAGLVNARHAHLDVVLEWIVRHKLEGHVRAVDILPDGLRQLQHGVPYGRGDVEVVVASARIRQAPRDAPGQVTRVGVVPLLLAAAEDVQGPLALHDLLDEVRHHVRHGQLHVAAHDLRVRLCALLANADGVERPDDRVGHPVLLPRALGKVLAGKLLEAVGALRWRGLAHLRLAGGEGVRTLVDHGAADNDHLLKEASLVRLNANVEGGAGDALVLRKEKVRQLVEHGDSADDRCGGDEYVDLVVKYHLPHQLHILGISAVEVEPRVVVEAFLQLSVLPEVVDSVDLVPLLQQDGDRVAHDEAVAASDQDLPWPVRRANCRCHSGRRARSAISLGGVPSGRHGCKGVPDKGRALARPERA
mmetsp:Transcript_101723/g.270605  ORF Transcript_101723/g.270605 Transcript_101723/m.270605 type:complete len:402 (-) Transcript_101723:3-1208(-)